MLCYACALPTMLYLVPTTILLGEMQGCGCRHEKLGLVFGWPRLDSLCRRFEFCWKWLLYYYDALWANFSLNCAIFWGRILICIQLWFMVQVWACIGADTVF